MGRGTPLHAAVGSQELDRINFLLEKGADMEMRNTLGQDAVGVRGCKRVCNFGGVFEGG